MPHYLIVTHTDAHAAGLSGSDFYGRSILTHAQNLDYALADVARSTRTGVTVIAAYDVTNAYERDDVAGMFPATDDRMCSPTLINLLAPVSLVKGKASDCSCGKPHGDNFGHTLTCRAFVRVFAAHTRGRAGSERVELRGAGARSVHGQSFARAFVAGLRQAGDYAPLTVI